MKISLKIINYHNQRTNLRCNPFHILSRVEGVEWHQNQSQEKPISQHVRFWNNSSKYHATDLLISLCKLQFRPKCVNRTLLHHAPRFVVCSSSLVTQFIEFCHSPHSVRPLSCLLHHRIVCFVSFSFLSKFRRIHSTRKSKKKINIVFVNTIMSRRCFLVAIDPTEDRIGRIELIDHTSITIGRSPQYGIRDEEISRQQMRLWANMRKRRVSFEMKGTNPPALNGVELKPNQTYIASAGDIIEIVSNRCKYRVEFVDVIVE